MAFFRKSRSQNYDLYSTHAYYVPGVGGVRIENTCVIGREASESLVYFTKDLLIL